MVFLPPEDPGLHGGEAGLLDDAGLGGATHQHNPARLLCVHNVARCLVLILTSMLIKQFTSVSQLRHILSLLVQLN